jgi:hypothetical protein
MVNAVAAPSQQKVANPSQVIGIGRREHERAARNQVPSPEMEQRFGAPQVLDELAGHDHVEKTVDGISRDISELYVEALLPKALDALARHIDSETLSGRASEMAMQQLPALGKVVHHPDVE